GAARASADTSARAPPPPRARASPLLAGDLDALLDDVVGVARQLDPARGVLGARPLLRQRRRRRRQGLRRHQSPDLDEPLLLAVPRVLDLARQLRLAALGRLAL